MSLLRAVALALLALQCSVFSVAHGHPAGAGGTAAGRHHEDDYGDDNSDGDEYYYYEEDDIAADTVLQCMCIFLTYIQIHVQHVQHHVCTSYITVTCYSHAYVLSLLLQVHSRIYYMYY